MAKKLIVIQSPFETVSGYGAKSRDIIRSIVKWADKKNFDVKLVSVRWGNCPKTALDTVSDRQLFDSRRLTTNLSAAPEVFVQISIPNECQPVGKYNIIFTSGIETTLCKGEWVEGANKMDLVVVPSQHAKSSLIHSKYKKKTAQGVEVPIELTKPTEVLFEGSDTSIYSSVNANLSNELTVQLDTIPEDFCFLFVGHWLQGELGADRKNVGMMIKTFLETFKASTNPPALIIKTSGANFSETDKEEILRKLHICESSTSQGTSKPNVYLLHGELTDVEMNSLYNHQKVKAHLSFTHGEGYGRPLQEASLSGKPVIAPNWSGHIDFLDKDLSILLDGGLQQVHSSAVNDWIMKESHWFTVNYSLASKKMVDVVKNYEPYKQKAQRLMQQNANTKSLDAMDAEMTKILDKYIPKFPEKVGIVLPSLTSLPSLRKATV